MKLWDGLLKRYREVDAENPVPVAGAPISATGTLQAADSAVVLELGGRTAVSLQLLDEQYNFTGQVAVEMSLDGGIWWKTVPTITVPLMAETADVDFRTAAIDTLVGHGIWTALVVAGATHVRARMVSPSAVPVQATLIATTNQSHWGATVPMFSLAGPLPSARRDASIQVLPLTRTGRYAITTSDTPYSVGDCLGGKLSLGSLAYQSPYGNGAVRLRSLVLKDDKDQKPELQVLVFGHNPTGTFTDNQPAAPSTNDLNKLLGLVSISAADWKTIQGTTKAVATVVLPEGGLPCRSLDGSSYWLALVAVTGADYAANSTDLVLEHTWEQTHGGS